MQDKLQGWAQGAGFSVRVVSGTNKISKTASQGRHFLSTYGKGRGLYLCTLFCVEWPILVEAYMVHTGVPDTLPTKELPSPPQKCRETVQHPRRIHYWVSEVYLELKGRESGVSWGK